jgi:hypothetical protein
MGGVNADVVAFGTIKGGRLVIRNRRQFDEQIRRFRDAAEVEIEVTQRRASRSLEQNAYYWGVVVQMLSDHTGYTPDELHDVLKMKFIPKRLAVCDGNGEVRDEFVLGGSTRKLNTLEFGEYLEQIRQWAAETLDVIIPDPNQDATTMSSEHHGHGWGV